MDCVPSPSKETMSRFLDYIAARAARDTAKILGPYNYCTHLLVRGEPSVCLLSFSSSKWPMAARIDNLRITATWAREMEARGILATKLYQGPVPETWAPVILRDEEPITPTPITTLYAWEREEGQEGQEAEVLCN